MKIFCSRPPTQKVDAGATQFAGAGTGQQKMEFPFLNQPVDFVQKVRKTLNFIDNNPLIFGAELLFDPTRVLAKGR
jgi:hypothetical protein